MTAEIFIGMMPEPATGSGTPDFPKLADFPDLFEGSDAVQDLASAKCTQPEPVMVDDGLHVGEVVDRYQITGMVAEGGCATLYLARCLPTGREVVLKLLRTEHLDALEAEGERARFKREIELLSRIQHPNVVRFIDSGRVCPKVENRGLARVSSLKPTPYIVMEYLGGETLSAILEQEGPLDVFRTLELVLPVLSGLHAIHLGGVVHRDITPSNVLIAKDDTGSLRPTILDFGVATAGGPGSGECNSFNPEGSGFNRESSGFKRALLGSPPYMSPEQTKSSACLCSLTDQYSLAVVIYECLTGRLPCEARATMPLLLKIASSTIVPPRQHNPRIPQALEDVLMRALAGDPQHRFPTLPAFGRALVGFADAPTFRHWAHRFGLTFDRQAS